MSDTFIELVHQSGAKKKVAALHVPNEGWLVIWPSFAGYYALAADQVIAEVGHLPDGIYAVDVTGRIGVTHWYIDLELIASLTRADIDKQISATHSITGGATRVALVDVDLTREQVSVLAHKSHRVRPLPTGWRVTPESMQVLAALASP